MKRILLILFIPTLLIADIDRVNEDVRLPYWPDYILSGDPNDLDRYFQILLKELQEITDEVVNAVNLGIDLDDTDVRYFGTKDLNGDYSNGDWRLIKVSSDDFELQKLISSIWVQQMKWSVALGTEIDGDFTADGTITGGTVTDGSATMTGGVVTATTITDGTASMSGGTVSATTVNATTMTATGTITGAEIVDSSTSGTSTEWEAAYNQRVDTWTAALNFASNVAKIAATSAYIIVGNAAGTGVAVAMSGDVFIDNAGATTIQANAVEESMLKAVDSASDEDIFTYEATTGDFEWHTFLDASAGAFTAGSIPFGDTDGGLTEDNPALTWLTSILNIDGTVTISTELNATDMVDVEDMKHEDHGDGTWGTGALVVEDFTLTEDADAGDFDILSIDRLEGVDNAVYIDMGGDGYVDIAADTAVRVFGVLQAGDGGTTNYVDISATGDQIFVGSAGLAYGSMYTNTEIAVTFVAANTFYEIDAAQAWMTGKVHNCTFADPNITVTNAGTYLITYTISAHVDASGEEIEIGIMIDSDNTDGPAHGAAGVQLEGRSHRIYSNSNDEGHQSGTAIIQLAAGQTISLAARDVDNDGDELGVEHGNMTVVQIAGGSA